MLVEQEFGLEEGKSVWRPAVRYAKNTAWQKLAKEEDLMRALIDEKFTGFNKFDHEDVEMTASELKELERFQSKVRL